jgi:hypothetical protein
MDEIITATTRLGKQLAYGEVISIISAEMQKCELGSDVYTTLLDVLNQVGELVNNN